MAHTPAQKHAFAQQVQDTAAAVSKAYRRLQDLCAIAATRGFGASGAQEITDLDLNPNDTAVGRNLGITAAQLFAVIGPGYTQLNNLMRGSSVTTYALGEALNSIRDDV
jgi:hypothetical protein